MTIRGNDFCKFFGAKKAKIKLRYRKLTQKSTLWPRWHPCFANNGGHKVVFWTLSNLFWSCFGKVRVFFFTLKAYFWLYFQLQRLINYLKSPDFHSKFDPHLTLQKVLRNYKSYLKPSLCCFERLGLNFFGFYGRHIVVLNFHRNKKIREMETSLYEVKKWKSTNDEGIFLHFWKSVQFLENWFHLCESFDSMNIWCCACDAHFVGWILTFHKNEDFLEILSMQYDWYTSVENLYLCIKGKLNDLYLLKGIYAHKISIHFW